MEQKRPQVEWPSCNENNQDTNNKWPPTITTTTTTTNTNRINTIADSCEKIIREPSRGSSLLLVNQNQGIPREEPEQLTIESLIMSLECSDDVDNKQQRRAQVAADNKLKPEELELASRGGVDNNNNNNNNNDKQQIVADKREPTNGANQDSMRAHNATPPARRPQQVAAGIGEARRTRNCRSELPVVPTSDADQLLANTLTSISSRRTTEQSGVANNKLEFRQLGESTPTPRPSNANTMISGANQATMQPLGGGGQYESSGSKTNAPISLHQLADLDSDGQSARSSSASSCASDANVNGHHHHHHHHHHQQVVVSLAREPEKSGNSRACDELISESDAAALANGDCQQDPRTRLLSAVSQLTRRRQELKTIDRQLVEIIDSYLFQLETCNLVAHNSTSHLSQENIMDLSSKGGQSHSSRSSAPSFNLKKSRLLGDREANTFSREEKVIQLEPKEQPIGAAAEFCGQPATSKRMYLSHQVEQNSIEAFGERPLSPVKRFKCETSMDLASGTQIRQQYHTFQPLLASPFGNPASLPFSQASSSAKQTPPEPSIMDMFRFQQQQQHHHHQLPYQIDQTPAINLNPLQSSASMGQYYHHQLQFNHHINQQINHTPQSFAMTTQQTINQQKLEKMSYRCHVCGSGFEDRHRLQQHLSIHLSLHPSWFEEKTIKETMAQYESRRGDYLCASCGLRFETTAEFDKHMQLHGDKPHQCELCSQDNNRSVSFRYYRQLLTHLRSHCFLYSCKFTPECKQTANRKDYLKLHILKHHLNNKLPEQYTICCH